MHDITEQIERVAMPVLLLDFFGIRGVGSFYYLAYRLNHSDIAGGERIWAIVSLVTLGSILLLRSRRSCENLIRSMGAILTQAMQ